MTESDDRSDDSSSGFVYQKTGLDDTDALSNATDALEDEVTVHNEQPSKKRSTGKVYSPYLSFKRVDIAEKTLQGSFLDGTWKRLNTTDSLRGTTIWYGMDGILPPKMTQVNNFLKSWRNKQLGPSTFCLQDLSDWVTARCQRADNDDTAYVAKNEIASLPERQFRAFITTNRLIGYTQYVSFVCYTRID